MHCMCEFGRMHPQLVLLEVLEARSRRLRRSCADILHLEACCVRCRYAARNSDHAVDPDVAGRRGGLAGERWKCLGQVEAVKPSRQMDKRVPTPVAPRTEMAERPQRCRKRAEFGRASTKWSNPAKLGRTQNPRSLAQAESWPKLNQVWSGSEPKLVETSPNLAKTLPKFHRTRS